MDEKRSISLPKGGTLEIEMSSAFIDKVRSRFCLTPDDGVTDDMIRMFVFGAVKSAVDKKEREMSGVQST